MRNTTKVWPFFLLYFPQILFGNPKGLADNSGVELSEQGPLLEIKAGDGAILSWDSFSIDAQETTRFHLPNDQASVLNRVNGKTCSKLLGVLESNGSVFLINPNGILFGPGSKINVANMVASTFDLSDENFLSKKISFRKKSDAPIQCDGFIEAKGHVFLAAASVQQTGLIIADSIYLASGDEILFDSKGTQRLIVSHEYGETPYEAAIFFEGKGQSYDEIFLDAGPGKLTLSGELEAEGGRVHLLGNEIHIFPEAKVDVSSDAGGGTVLVGGDYKGLNREIPNAKNIWMGTGAEIIASGLSSGNGGKVILWGDNACLFYGNIQAEGGINSGNGGFVETSSPKWLDSNGFVSTFAPNGSVGTYLMDPCAVTIAAGPYAGIAASPPPSFTFSGATANVSTSVVTTLQGYLNSNNVTVDASTGTAGAASIDINTAFIWNSANTLTLNAPGGIVNINVDIDSNSTAFAGANALVVQTGTLNFNNGAVFDTDSGGVLITANQTNITSTNAATGIRVDDPGTITINGNVTVQAGTAAGANANAFIDAIQSVTINGNASVTAGTSGPAANEDANGFIESNTSILITGNATVQGGTGIMMGDADGYIRAQSTGTLTINGDATAFGGNCQNTGGNPNSDGYFQATNGDLVIYGDLSGFGGVSSGTTSATGGVDILGAGNVFIYGDVFLLGGTSTNGNASGSLQTEAGGDITIYGNVHVEGGVATGTGDSRSVISARTGGAINIIGGNSISCIGGTGTSASEAQIHTANAVPGAINIDISGPIVLTANQTAAVGNHDAHINALEGGSINIRSGSISLLGGVSTASQAEIRNQDSGGVSGPISIQTGPLTITARSADAGIFTEGIGQIDVIADRIQLLGGDASLGSAEITTETGNIDITCSSLDLLAGTAGGGATTANIESQTGNITINSAGLIRLVGGNHANSQAFIHSDIAGNITINCGDLALTGGSAATTNASITTDSGDIAIHSFNNATLSAALSTAKANIQTFGSDLTLIADNNISLNGFSILSTPASGGNLLAIAGNDFFIDADAQVVVFGTGELTLVCDNDFPTPFGFGSGQFILVPGGTIRNFGGQPVRIFTVSPLQNSFTPPTPATINNFPFFPSIGLTLVDVPPYEYWCIYYDPAAGAIPPFSGSGIGGNPFTVFYKLCEQTLTVLSTPIQQFLFDLDTFDTYFDEFYTQFEFDYRNVSPDFAAITPQVQGNTFRRKLYFENIGRNPEPELLNNMPFTAQNDEIKEEYE